MNKLTVVFTILLQILLYSSKAQNCIPTVILFTTQAQVDNFPSDYKFERCVYKIATARNSQDI